MPAAALLGGVGRAGMNSLQLPGEEGANTFYRETGTKQDRVNIRSHPTNIPDKTGTGRQTAKAGQSLS
jgi:hypothetical protein